MPQTLMLINPARRPSKRKKARSPAQRAATARMLSARRGSRKANPAKRTKRRYTALTALRGKKSVRGRRRNPIGNSVLSMFMPAAIGAVGAVAINTIESQLVARFMPAAMSGPMGRYVTRIALALALGTMGGKLIGNARARQAAEGALVVTLYDVIGSTISSVLPVSAAATPVQGIGAYASSLENSNMGAYAPLAGMSAVDDSPYAYTSN